jgi:hypothetical protein
MIPTFSRDLTTVLPWNFWWSSEMSAITDQRLDNIVNPAARPPTSSTAISTRSRAK